MRRIITKKNEYLPRHHCTTQHLCLFALGLPAPVVIRKDRKTGWHGDRDKSQLRTTLLTHSGPRHTLLSSHSRDDTQVKLTYQHCALLDLCANCTGHFLNIFSCDFSSSVCGVGGEGCCSICQCAQVNLHIHTTVCDTLTNNKRPALRRLAFSSRPSV